MKSLDSDLAGVAGPLGDAFGRLSGARILVTGGTGFFGAWLLESVRFANDRLGVPIRLAVVSRSPAAFARRFPHLGSHRAISWVAGDVRTFAAPEGEITHVIHAATVASSAANQADPLETFDVVVGGTRHVLEIAEAKRIRGLLFTSSGAVYGRQQPEVANQPEDAPAHLDPSDPKSTYGEAKRAAEQLCQVFALRARFSCALARGYAFTGPHLPLDGGFAAGDFVRDALTRDAIEIAGDGTPVRSYLYASDLVAWLWTMLARADGVRAFNVGSESPVTLGELAHAVADAAAAVGRKVHVRNGKQPCPGSPPERYVPSTARARTELGLEETVSLREAVGRTLAWAAEAAT